MIKLYFSTVLYVSCVKCFFALLVPDLAGSQTYAYKYEALLFSGLHQEGLARAGIKINSKVLISAAAENVFLLKVPELLSQSWSFVLLLPTRN